MRGSGASARPSSTAAASVRRALRRVATDQQAATSSASRLCWALAVRRTRARPSSSAFSARTPAGEPAIAPTDTSGRGSARRGASGATTTTGALRARRARRWRAQATSVATSASATATPANGCTAAASAAASGPVASRASSRRRDIPPTIGARGGGLAATAAPWTDLLVAGARLALLHHGPARALAAVGGDQAGVEVRVRLGGREVVDVEPLDALVGLGDGEHAAQRPGRARRAERERVAELHDAARLGQPDLALARRAQQRLGALGREAVGVRVVVDAPDLRERPGLLGERPDEGHRRLDVVLVEDVERDDPAGALELLAGLDGRVVVGGRRARLVADRLADDDPRRPGAHDALAAVGLVPRRDRLDLRIGLHERRQVLRELRRRRDVPLTALRVRVLEGDEDVLPGARRVGDPVAQRCALRAARAERHHVVGRDVAGDAGLEPLVVGVLEAAGDLVADADLVGGERTGRYEQQAGEQHDEQGHAAGHGTKAPP